MIKYAVTEDAISFYDKEEIIVVTSDQKYLYAALKDSLISNSTIDIIDSPKEFLKKCLKERSSCFGIDKKIKQIEEAGMPIEPFLSFVSRIPERFLKYNPDLLNMIGTVDLPLTWDGNLIAYQRASWIKNDNEVDAQDIPTSFKVFDLNRGRRIKKWARDFKPFDIAMVPQNVCDFNWAQNQCPDTGATFEVIVQPEYIRSILNHQIRTSQIIMLSRLGEKVSNDQKSTTMVVDIETGCSEFSGGFAIRLPFNASTSAKLINHMFNQTVKTQQLNKTIKIRVPVTSC
jgi:hypothetical protein